MPDKVLAFYIRLSSEDRDLKTNALKNESNSVFNQRRLLQDYYDEHESLRGYRVIVFCDDGVTGTHFDRPKFDELIEMARNQEIHMRAHPEVKKKTEIARALQIDRGTVAKYYDEILQELQVTM